MAQVFPFQGLRYSLSKVPIEKVVTQPYDKISKDMQDRYYALHPNNIIRIVLGRANPGDSETENVYTRAAQYLKDWRKEGILETLPAPAFFVYFQKFVIPGTSDVQIRKGFVGTTHLEDYNNKVVFPHERTLTGPKKDRLELLRHTRTHFEQIFMLYEDPGRRIDQRLEEAAAGKPDIQVEDEYGVMHTIWTVPDPGTIEWIQKEMAGKKLIIADGHHRYETALSYRDERRSQAGRIDPDATFERLSMTFFNMDSPGLAILPTHRVLANVQGFDSNRFFERASRYFDVREAPVDAATLRSELKKLGNERLTIGVAMDRGERRAFLSLKSSLDLASAMPDLSPKQRLLDVVVLHRLAIDQVLGIGEEAVRKESNITYLRELDGALNAVRDGRSQAAFLLNATNLHQMRDIAYEGHVMPQKSTDFYPKVLSGLTMYAL